jgi:subtilase family serine protease
MLSNRVRANLARKSEPFAGAIFAGYVDADEDNAVNVLSSSFGGCELFYFPAWNHGVDCRGILTALHELLMQGNSQGITFLASSGDSAGKSVPM